MNDSIDKEAEDDSQTVVGVFAVAEEDWGKFVEMMEDSADNFSTWVAWKVSADSTVAKLSASGVDARLVVADLDEFREWCGKNGLALDGQSRSKFASSVLAKRRT